MERVKEMMPADKNQLTSYIDPTNSLVQILFSVGWHYNQTTGEWEKLSDALVNKKGFLELRRFLFSVLHKENQLSQMSKRQAENHVLGLINDFTILFGMNMKAYGIPDVEVFHLLVSEIRANVHFHLFKSVNGKMIDALTQQISTIHQITTNSTPQEKGFLSLPDWLKPKKEAKKDVKDFI